MADYAPGRYTAGTNQTDYSIPFPYLAPTDVKVAVNGLLAPVASPASWPNPTTVRLSSAPAPGATVIVYRETPEDPYVIFNGATPVNATNVNKASQQALFNAGEAQYGNTAYIRDRAYIEAGEFGVVGDHNGTLPSTDNTATFRAFITALTNAQPKTGHFRGGVRLRPASQEISGELSFSLVGDSPRASYLYLETQFAGYFLILNGTSSTWSATNSSFTGGVPAPPPQDLNTIILREFAVFGRGTDANGNSVEPQRGLAFKGGHSRATIEHVHCYNINGTALCMGFPRGTSGRAGVRESVLRNVHVVRCGSKDEPAWIIAGYGGAYGPNFLYIFDCECSLSRGKGLVIRNRAKDNTIHNLSITGLKLHGTGHSGANPDEIPPPETQEALTIEGLCDNYNSIRDLTIVQSAQDPSKYALNFIAAPLWTAVRAATAGSNITLSGTQTVDGVSLVAGDRCLVKDQTSPAQNGIYVVAAGGWARAADLDHSNQFREPPPAVKVSEGMANAGTYWTYAGDPQPALGTDDITFVQFDWGYPSNFTITGAIEQSKNGVLIEGGNNISVELADNSGIDGNVFSIGAGVDGPISLKFNPRSAGGVVGICAAQSSPFVVLRDSQLAASPALWTKYLAKIKEAASTKNNGTSTTDAADLAFAIAANETWQFVFKVFYYTKAPADFKYTLAGSAAGASIALTKNIRAPGATAYTMTTASAFPSNEAVTSSVDGYGEVELRGTIVNGGTANTISFKFAQNTAHASDTLVLAGSLYEAKRLA